MVEKRFKAKEGSSFGDEKAQIYGDELEKIRIQNGGILTPQLVLDSARKKDSKIHDYFEWDNNLAGEKYRISMARFLISHIEIVVTYKGTDKEQRAYLNVTKAIEDNDEEVQRVYVTMEKALSEPELKKQVLSNAIREIDYWKGKYKDYEELGEIFKAIEKTKNKITY